MILIVGLGNPGSRYKNTRHNVGFMVVDKLASSEHVSPDERQTEAQWRAEQKFQAQVYKSQDVIYVKPLTYMNLSGITVKAICDFYKIKTDNLIAIHDDIDLPLGKIRISSGGASGGHHGVQSLINHLNTDQFVRFRIGIGTGTGSGSTSAPQEQNVKRFRVVKYVLSKFKSAEVAQMKTVIDRACMAVRIYLEDGLEKAMNEFN
ncbi:aminoacyl-tRNA hydrolase [Candidatus Gottesmanbacteria bacterium RBG_16_43_7]|uniref:Peptidyl-tRNA hydrolase n=1 Tax=Candidatus Gottesmanbacteria bacterium RBG_16_43_7 TaxID=1798373 RepID=A0A1F5Z9L9_9BACT|nr:MAG: aminoacyl-tRNA hydrolase [Candidatus Gottesmanbacteria bacterium RBG_16_43_7]